ncbi:hypothetical protein FI667_g12828, partial [Globisporangium splendens]
MDDSLTRAHFRGTQSARTAWLNSSRHLRSNVLIFSIISRIQLCSVNASIYFKQRFYGHFNGMDHDIKHLLIPFQKKANHFFWNYTNYIEPVTVAETEESSPHARLLYVGRTHKRIQRKASEMPHRLDQIGGEHRADDDTAALKQDSRSRKSESGADTSYDNAPQYKIEVDDADHHTIVDMTLRTVRYVVVLVFGLGFAIAYAGFSFKGMVLRHNVYDEEGSSTNADRYVSQYSSITGPLMFAVSKILEFYCETLVFPTLQTYLHNCSFFPGDQPQRVESKAKKNALFWFFKIIYILINVGLASLYVSQLSAGIERNISTQDLYSTNTIANLESTVSVNEKEINVVDTILRSVVTGNAEPFELKTDCGTANQSGTRPKLAQVDTTTLSIGFPLNDWNYDILPVGLIANTSVNFTYGEYKKESSKYDKEFLASGLNVTRVFETMLQGTVLFERSITDMDFTQTYDCSYQIEKARRRRRRRLQEVEDDEGDNTDEDFGGDDGSTEGTIKDAKCWGFNSSAQLILDQLRFGNATYEVMVEKMIENFEISQPAVATDDVEMSFDTYSLADLISMETIAIDIPLDGDFAQFETELDPVSNVSVLYLDVEDCGRDKCVYKSSNTFSFYRHETSLTPYVTGCNTENLYVDEDLQNFFPAGCTSEENSLMTYGLGTYIKADAFRFDSAKGKSVLVNPRSYVALSFGRVSWKYKMLDKQYGADCTDDKCSGLSIPYNSGNNVLLVGEDFIPTDHVNNTFLRPLRLLTLNSIVVPQTASDGNMTEWIWSPINLANVGSGITARDGGSTSQCDSLADSYIDHIERNHLYLEKPLQSMYTSALYYLFQNGLASRFVEYKVEEKDATRLDLDGALEIKEIKFSIPLTSGIATFTGCLAMCLLAAAVILLPTDRVKLSPNTTPAAQYVQILTDDMYPDVIHKKRLRFDNGDVLLMNEYIVDNIVLHAKRDHSKKIYL